MSSFADITKYLNRFKCRKASKEEAASAGVRFDKYYSKSMARPIVKVPLTITIPEFNPEDHGFHLGWNGIGFGCIMNEWHINMEDDFYIKSYSIETHVNGFNTVRFIKDGKVYRYFLFPKRETNQASIIIFQGIFHVPFYTNQLIRKHFVVESWNLKPFTPLGIDDNKQIRLITSILQNPTDGDMTEIPVTDITVKCQEILHAIPEDLPTDNTEQVGTIN